MKSNYRPAFWPLSVRTLMFGSTLLATGLAHVEAAGYLLVTSYQDSSVLAYDESTGAYAGTLVPSQSAGLRDAMGIVVGNDGNLYVASGVFWDNGTGQKAVLRFSGVDGTYLSDFADQNLLEGPRGVLFGHDGNLYVADTTAAVLRFNGTTGQFTDYFVPPLSGNLAHPLFMVFGPDGDLYVGEVRYSAVKRYDGQTGAYKGDFVPAGVGGLSHPQGLVFGPDGDLYVACGATVLGPGPVLHFQGPGNYSPGAYVNTFIPAGYGGLSDPVGIIFGPGIAPGRQALYVASATVNFNINSPKTATAVPGTSQILRYDALTGQFLGAFVTPDSGGLQLPNYLTFTESDPATLSYPSSTP